MALSSFVLAVLGIGLILGGISLAGPAVRKLAQAGDQALAQTARSIRLDPETVRVEIESLESAVYGSLDAYSGQSQQIRAAATTLAESITHLPGAPKPLLNRFSREIADFGARSDPRQPMEPSSRKKATLADWETVRARVFSEAQWYRRGDQDDVPIGLTGSISNR